MQAMFFPVKMDNESFNQILLTITKKLNVLVQVIYFTVTEYCASAISWLN